MPQGLSFNEVVEYIADRMDKGHSLHQMCQDFQRNIGYDANKLEEAARRRYVVKYVK